MLFVDYFFYSLVQENKRMFNFKCALKRDSKFKLKCINTRKYYLIVLRRVEGSRRVVIEIRGKVLKEVVGHYPVEVILL